MKWHIKIENKPNQRITVIFDPLTERLLFTGEYKPHNREWVLFYQNSIGCWIIIHPQNAPDIVSGKELITAEKIEEEISKTYEELKKKVEIYENLAEGFSAIKVIEVVEE